MERIVIALGGNALIRFGGARDFDAQNNNVSKAVGKLSKLLNDKRKQIIITHGNGPQVGDELLRNIYSRKEIAMLPLPMLVAETQATIGAMIEAAVIQATRDSGRNVVTVITHVKVDKNDRAFAKPTKPIGPFYSKKELDDELRREKFAYVKVKGKYRRVVASPQPISIMEKDSIERELNAGSIVIACGGGGIPVISESKGFRRVDAVIDKDLAAQVIANDVNADALVILTDVKNVYYDIEMRRAIHKIRYTELSHLLDTFEEGTMQPKVFAALQFIKKGGKEAHIGSLDHALQVTKGRSGTTVFI